MKYSNPPTVPDINYSPGNYLCIFLKKPKSVILIILYPTKILKCQNSDWGHFFDSAQFAHLLPKTASRCLKT